LKDVQAFGEAVSAAWSRAVSGQEQVLRSLLVTLLIGGNALLVGPPGTAKTLAVKVLARCLSLPFGRIQFTPDLLPADLIGSPVLEQATGTFRIRRGPVFTTFLLADEINRAPAKTQAALLEAMEERQVTIEGETTLLPPTFTVFATQNPLEFEGTYPLPEAQLDRFSLQIDVGYPSEAAERELLQKVDQGFDARNLDALAIAPVADEAGVLALRASVREVTVKPAVLEHLLALIRRTREEPRLLLGASPRAAGTLLNAAKALAALRGRAFVTPDDVVDLTPEVLRHRVVLHGEAELAGMTPDDVLARLLAEIPVPR